MCANFKPSNRDFISAALSAKKIPFDFKPEAYIGYEAPIIRNAYRASADDPVQREQMPARFGLIPFWCKEGDAVKMGRMAYNCRSETVATKPMFRQAWSRRQFCLVPVEHFYEPCWEGGRAMRWKLYLLNEPEFAIAAIWDTWRCGDIETISFSMLTVNADEHPLMNRMHRPGYEKRMPVILERADWERWLGATTEEAMALCKTYPAELMGGEPAPPPPRSAKVAA